MTATQGSKVVVVVVVGDVVLVRPPRMRKGVKRLGASERVIRAEIILRHDHLVVVLRRM